MLLQLFLFFNLVLQLGQIFINMSFLQKHPNAYNKYRLYL